MRKSIPSAVMALAMGTVLSTAAPSMATHAEFVHPELTAAQTDCGEVTVTLTNPNNFTLVADFGTGEPTEERDWSDVVVAEGPYADETFGLYYENNVTAVNGTESDSLTFAEDAGGGEVVVTYRVKEGGEQRAYLLPQTITIDTDCEPPTSPTAKSDCKRGGWEAYGFKNQGQCVSSLRANERAGKA